MRTCSNPGNIWRVHQALKVMDLVGGGANQIDHSGNDLLCVSERHIELVSCLKERERGKCWGNGELAFVISLPLRR